MLLRAPLRRAAPAVLGLLLAACASARPTPAPASAAPPAPAVPAVTWEEKIGWIVRLEDQRLLRDPHPPPARVVVPATASAPAVAAPPPPSDLTALLADRDAPVRARAALALGRVGLPEAIDPLVRLLDDPEVEVRQTAAFALGLIGGDAARAPLLTALADPAPGVQGRAAESLGLIGSQADAAPIAEMVRVHLRSGALAGLEPDDLGYPLAPPVEAARLGIYALARLAAFEPLAATVLDASGQAVSSWWPVAYALQRVNDARAVPALVALLDTPGRYTASFAARGLARMPPPHAVAALGRIVAERRADPMVVVQAMRSLAAAGASDATAALLRIIRDPSANAVVRAEATDAFMALAGSAHVELLMDLVTDASPDTRAAAARALARVDPDAFMSSLASLDADYEWRVRAAQAEALGSLASGRGLVRLHSMLGDADDRVIPAVLKGLAAAGAADAARVSTERLASPDPIVRAAAAGVLAGQKAVQSVEALVAAYRTSGSDTTYVARAAILAALDRLDPQRARPLLMEALADPDWAVRVRAAALLREHGARADPARPATIGRPVDDPEWQRRVAPPYSPRAYIDTTRGTIELELTAGDAPLTTANFVSLARTGFFDGVRIHRVVADFVVQAGDPRGDSEGGPGYTIRDEINQRPYLRGTLGMALDWEDTGGSQFFITLSPQPHLDARYTVFGQVVRGMDVVDSLTPSDVIERVRIWDGVNGQ